MTTRILNNIEHKDLKVDVRPDRRYGDFVNRTLVFTTEYADLHKEFPILIHEDPDSQELSGHVILGLERDENLFIENGEWRTRFIPATLARGPFSIGYQRHEQQDDEEAAIMIMVDEEHPRCGVEDGEAVFLEYGGEAPYMEFVRKALQKIRNGISSDRTFFQLLKELDLLEPVSIKITLTQEKQYSFGGYHTISQEKLAGLDGGSLQRLHEANMLGLVFYVVSSLGNFQRLIDLKNARSPGGQ